MIQWPCIFKLEGDSELMYLESELVLASEFESLIWSGLDQLIDSNGQRYLVNHIGESYIFESQGIELSLESVTKLIQEHEFAKMEMCLTKIQFTSVQEAIHSLALEK
ncbi:DUF4144 domain-containing protein [Vibrio sp. ZSDE26]|uniref:DUF4144 domain-containing protein n=1 Tax=Vibrio amylolyticus TaxID=2847292 RepID=A0A9X1XLM1_9VIBR|nr:DUF4144 domain-containing protein [Vibrio amylolyticus]MCK6264716.1 DUF4144 domain-containing protein [Vibrio amylolyticus]